MLPSLLWHLGPLHPVEAYLMTGLALAPFVVVAVIVALVSRRDRRAAELERAARTERGSDGGRPAERRPAQG